MKDLECTIPLAFVFQDAWSGAKMGRLLYEQNHISNGLAGVNF